jgi:parvulin-like peptidyl-prolyl isomerase
MTLRARPVARRRGRAGWDSGDRRNTLINLGFFLAIGLSAVILIGYAGWSWYDDHFGAAATVDGKVITKDDLRNRLRVESFRLDYVERRIQTLIALGRISPSDGQQQLQSISQVREQLANLSLERLVDTLLQARLATEQGITVSDEDISAQLLESATTSEQRHTWMIEIEPVANPDTDEVGPDERREALGRAQRALARLKNGESWEDVARTASDSALAAQGGDLGWLAEESGYDEAFMAAVFDAEINVPTDIIEGDDDIFRIGRYTELAPETIDGTFEEAVVDAGITVADYRVVAGGDVLREKLSEKIVADLSQPGPQRHVLQIYLPEPNASSTGVEEGVKVRHIVFAPNDDSGKADDLPDDDPAWVAAKAEADKAYAELKANPKKFDEMARELSDEGSASLTGGKQPWYYESSSVDAAFKAAILADGLTPGQLLEPVKTAFGWHVIQFMRPTGAGEDAYLESLKAQVADEASFRQVAKDTTEGEGAEEGGDIGWIAKGQFEDLLEKGVFDTAIGAVSAVIEVAGDGTYLFRVLAEETRTPTEEQIEVFEANGFNNWYTLQKEAADIEYHLGTTTGTA